MVCFVGQASRWAGCVWNYPLVIALRHFVAPSYDVFECAASVTSPFCNHIVHTSPCFVSNFLTLKLADNRYLRLASPGVSNSSWQPRIRFFRWTGSRLWVASFANCAAMANPPVDTSNVGLVCVSSFTFNIAVSHSVRQLTPSTKWGVPLPGFD